MIKCGFFDAVMENGEPDRLYSSDDFNAFFDGILSEGIFERCGGAFKVSAGSGMQINVESGKALIDGHWITSDAVERLDISAAHPVKDRYTSIVIRYDQSARSLSLVTKDGEAADDPAKPELQATDDVKELLIANVLVKAGADSISDDDITDVRTYVEVLPGSAKVNYRRYNHEHESVVTEIPIPEQYRYTISTDMQVYVNGLLLGINEYSVSLADTVSGYKIVFAKKLNADADIDIVLIS